MILLYFLVVVACLAVAISSLVGVARGWRPSIEPRTSERIALWAAAAAAVAVAVRLLFIPAIGSRSTSIGADGVPVAAEQRLTLLESGQWVILPILAIVLALAVTPLVIGRRRWRYWFEVCAALILAVFSLLSGFSIGLYLLPVATLMFLAVLLGRSSGYRAV